VYLFRKAKLGSFKTAVLVKSAFDVVDYPVRLAVGCHRKLLGGVDEYHQRKDGFIFPFDSIQ
jgi:hypothetical protein